jgi:uncharacterized membrane protein
LAKKKRKSEVERANNALTLSEQAFHLLRTAPLSAHVWCFLGMVPFALGLLLFWTEMSRGAHAEHQLPNASLTIVFIYFWMKICQGFFCRVLWKQLSPGGTVPRMTMGRFIRYSAVQVFIHAFSLPVLGFSLLFVIPLGWVYATFQNASIFAYTVDFERKALRGILGLSIRQSHHAAMQNHMVLLILKAFAIFVWINAALIIGLLPLLAKMFLGVESVFTQSWQAAYLNTTFIATTFVGAWLVISPFSKAIYVIRCFEGVSETTGADLLARLGMARRERDEQVAASGGRGAIAALVAGLLLLGSLGVTDVGAQEPMSAGESGEDQRIAKMEDTIRGVIARPEFDWRLPPGENGEEGVEAEAGDHAISRWIVGAQRSISDFISDGIRALRNMINPPDFKPPSMSPPSTGFFDAIAGMFAGLGGLQTIAFILIIALIVGLIVMLVVFFLKRHKEDVVEDEDDEGSGIVDLESEDLLADELPENEWLQLAREQVANGEPRLAVRALFLASLAYLSNRKLLRIVKWKANRDYRNELGFKARDRATLLGAFSDNVKTFDQVWYGDYDAGAVIDEFTKNYETIKSG